MPEPFTIAFLAFVLKAVTFKTAAAPVVKGVAASTSVAYTTGAATTVAGATLVGITLTGAIMVAIGAIIHKAASGGYMSVADARRYAQEIEKLPLYKQQKILAQAEGTLASELKGVFHSNGVYA
jgi:hypothetical protein